MRQDHSKDITRGFELYNPRNEEQNISKYITQLSRYEVTQICISKNTLLQEK